MIWTIFDIFRSVLIDCINISKFKNNDTSRCGCTGGEFKGVGYGLVGENICSCCVYILWSNGFALNISSTVSVIYLPYF